MGAQKTPISEREGFLWPEALLGLGFFLRPTLYMARIGGGLTHNPSPTVPPTAFHRRGSGRDSFCFHRTQSWGEHPTLSRPG